MPQINHPRFTWERKRAKIGRETKQQSAILPHNLKAGVGRKKNENMKNETALE